MYIEVIIMEGLGWKVATNNSSNAQNCERLTTTVSLQSFTYLFTPIARYQIKKKSFFVTCSSIYIFIL